MNRKNTNKFLIAVIISALFSACGLTDSNVSMKQIFAMDTAVTLKANNDNISAYSERVQMLDNMLSAYDGNSEISKLNADKSAEISAETVDLLSKAKALSEQYPQVDITAGALVKLWNINGESPKIPLQQDIDAAKSTVGVNNLTMQDNMATLKNNAEIDLGSCAKGYALDVLYEMFRENNEEYAVVSFGSSSLVYGERPDGEEFITEIVSPENKNKTVLRFKTNQAFISTSGGYERYFEAEGKKYSHIIDLNTGAPAETDLTSVTVITENSGLLSDFMSTCVYIDGTEKIGEYLNNKDFEIIALDENKNIYCSESIKNKIEILDKNYNFAS